MTARLTDREYEELLRNAKVRKAMTIRCEEQGHDWENACSVFLQFYQECKWCGERRNVR